jgi:hypothetical protein
VGDACSCGRIDRSDDHASSAAAISKRYSAGDQLARVQLNVQAQVCAGGCRRRQLRGGNGADRGGVVLELDQQIVRPFEEEQRESAARARSGSALELTKPTVEVRKSPRLLR